MVPSVLIVDDDRSWLRLVYKTLQKYSENFTIRMADTGERALAILKREHIMLVVSDLRMPGMDGFDLLTRILANYPDVPVFIVTAYDRPKTKDVVFRSGAVGYLTKPLSPSTLAKEINKILRKKFAGGNLHNVSLETFLQLVEMEQQTCTLHVSQKTANTGGALFFRNGDIINARIGDQQGKAAAYEILSWNSVSVSIENDCVFEEKLIEGDLQAILLDAMRFKDENNDNDEANTTQADDSEIILDETLGAPTDGDSENIEDPWDMLFDETDELEPDEAAVRAPGEELSPVESTRRQLADSLLDFSGVKDIYTDDAWDAIIAKASKLGELFDLGQLTVLYTNKGDEGQYIAMPAEKTKVILIDPDAPRDRIIGAVS